MSESANNKGGILERYATVLETLSTAPSGLSLTELVQATGLPQGTAHRLISALQQVGYVKQRDGRKIYILGPRLLRLLHAGTTQHAVTSTARPILDELVRRFKETAFVAKLIGTHVESIAMVVPTGEGQSYVQPGRVMPIHAAASAKAIFAFQNDAVIDLALGEPLIKYTENTRTTPEEIKADLESVRRLGFAACNEELDPGVLSYACPVQLEGAGVLYSVGIVGLSKRMRGNPKRSAISALRSAANELAARLQSGPPGLVVVGTSSPEEERAIG